MKKKEQVRVRLAVIVCAIIVLLAAGISLTIRMFHNYSALMLVNTDNQLMSLARSVDLSAESRLDRYVENLEHTLEHEERMAAEEKWLEKNDTQALLAFLNQSLLGQDETVIDIVVFAGDKVLLSQSGEMDYTLGTQEDMIGDAGGCLCLRSDGMLTIAVAKHTERDLTYAALFHVNEFYEGITENLSDNLHNEIVMMDAQSQMLIHRQQELTIVNKISDFSEEDSKYSMLKFLIKQQQEEKEGTEFCDAVSSATGRAYTARMAVVPANKESNGLFAVGVSTDYDEVTRPMRQGSVRLIIYGGVVLLTTVGLLILLAHTARGSERAKREVELLKEKNAAMEALNRQTQEFAHHQRLELMGTLTSGIAHEFNNLLAPIMGYSILILEKLPPEESELYDEVLEIYNTSTKAKTVISRLQDLARKHAGDEFRNFRFDDVVQKAIDIAAPAKPKTVELELSLNGEDSCIFGNETQMSQLILNLLINAFHATEEKCGRVTVHTSAENGRILLKVSDNGYGMTEEVKQRMYEPFFTTKKGGEGTGLGLAIVAQIVEEHGGSIHLESKVDEGTTFFIEFPMILSKS